MKYVPNCFIPEVPSGIINAGSIYALLLCPCNTLTQTNQSIVLCQLGRLYQMLEGLGTKIEKDGLLDRYRKPELSATYVEEWSSLTKNLLKALPYSLTSSQLRAVSEIIWDLKRPIPMNRLLQVLHFTSLLLLSCPIICSPFLVIFRLISYKRI